MFCEAVHKQYADCRLPIVSILTFAICSERTYYGRSIRVSYINGPSPHASAGAPEHLPAASTCPWPCASSLSSHTHHPPAWRCQHPTMPPLLPPLKAPTLPQPLSSSFHLPSLLCQIPSQPCPQRAAVPPPAVQCRQPCRQTSPIRTTQGENPGWRPGPWHDPETAQQLPIPLVLPLEEGWLPRADRLPKLPDFRGEWPCGILFTAVA